MIPFRKIITLTTLLALFCISVFGQTGSAEIGSSAAGRRSFSSIVNNDGKSCADCHYSIEPDTINWNPSVNDLAGRAVIYLDEGIGSYFENPEGDVLREAHAGAELTGTEESEIISYLSGLDDTPPVPVAGFKWRLFLFLAMFVLLILFRIEKTRVRKVPRTLRRLMIPAVWTVILVIMFQEAVAFNRSQYYAPVQPIKFSHTIHATDNQIDCNYCHSGVLKGRYAGTPPVSLCMNCHKHVQEGTRTGKFEIRKILQAAEDSIPIRWVRVHNLPDYTYFNHMQHVTIGGVECVTCHGEVENMHIVSQTEDLSMGWCIDCHDITPLDFSNEYYKTHFPEILDSLQTGKLDSVMVSNIGGRECGRCHY